VTTSEYPVLYVLLFDVFIIHLLSRWMVYRLVHS